MPKVILDGIGAGMTEEEYERKRAVDCQIAAIVFDPSFTYSHRDDEGGIPFFSFDMNGAWSVFGFMMKRWSYLAQQKFWELLQQRAGLDGVAFQYPAYPDVFKTLVDSMPEDICHAFLDTVNYHRSRNASLIASSGRASDFGDSVRLEEFKEVLEDGREINRTRAIPQSAPWVHNS